jgi:hypothetical protein
MKIRSILLIFALLAVIITAVLPVDTVQAASTTLARKPVLYKTDKGADSGNPVSVLKVRDQSTSADDPSSMCCSPHPARSTAARRIFRWAALINLRM